MSFASTAPELKVKLEIIVPDNDNAPKAEVLSQKEYFQLLWELAAQGVLATKRSEVIAFPLVNLGIVTEGNKGGNVETENVLALHSIGIQKAGPLHLLFDPSLFNREQAKAATRQIFDRYGSLVTSLPSEVVELINNGKAEIRVRASVQGMYTMEAKNLRADYESTDIANMYRVKPGTGRLCLDVNKPFEMPVTWGTFAIPAGGTIAVRYEDIEALTKALHSVAEGKASIEEALYAKDKGGNTVAKYDVYGMYDGFFASNYKLVETKDVPETATRALADFRSKPGAQNVPTIGG